MDYGAKGRKIVVEGRVTRGGVAAERERGRAVREKGRRVDTTYTLRCCAG